MVGVTKRKAKWSRVSKIVTSKVISMARLTSIVEVPTSVVSIVKNSPAASVKSMYRVRSSIF